MMMIIMMMMAIMKMMIIMCFLLPKGPQTGLVPKGTIKYDVPLFEATPFSIVYPSCKNAIFLVNFLYYSLTQL